MEAQGQNTTSPSSKQAQAHARRTSLSWKPFRSAPQYSLWERWPTLEPLLPDLLKNSSYDRPFEWMKFKAKGITLVAQLIYWANHSSMYDSHKAGDRSKLFWQANPKGPARAKADVYTGRKRRDRDVIAYLPGAWVHVQAQQRVGVLNLVKNERSDRMVRI